MAIFCEKCESDVDSGIKPDAKCPECEKLWEGRVGEVPLRDVLEVEKGKSGKRVQKVP